MLPHKWQPTRLPHPWDSPGKNTGVVAISFSNAWKWKLKMKSLSHVRLLATPWTAAHQAPPSMGFSRQEYWRGVPLPISWEATITRLHRFHQRNPKEVFFFLYISTLQCWFNPIPLSYHAENTATFLGPENFAISESTSLLFSILFLEMQWNVLAHSIACDVMLFVSKDKLSPVN